MTRPRIPNTLLTRTLLGHTLLALVLLAACAFAGCTARHQAPPSVPVGTKNMEGVWNMRHRVQLQIPGHPALHFSGMMRLDTTTRTLHVAGVAGLGMHMFSLRITPDEATVEYMHPLLRKIPQAESRMIACFRTVWFDYLPQTWSYATVRLQGVRITASAKTLADLWPEHLHYVDERAPFTLNIRLLQAQQETQQ